MRTSENPKGFTVKLRIDDEMNAFLQEKAKKKSISVSELIRKLIETDMREEKSHKRYA